MRMRRGRNEVNHDGERGSKKGGEIHEVLHDREDNFRKERKSSA